MNDRGGAAGTVFHRESRTVAKHVLYGIALSVGMVVLFLYRDVVAVDLAPSLASVPGISIPLAESILTWTVLLVFLTCTPLFVATTGFLLYRRANPVAALEIDADGFTDRTSLTNLGRVSWSNVDRIEVVLQMNVPQIRVTLVDPEAVLAEHGPIKAAYLRLNQRVTRGDAALPLHQLDAEVDDVVSAIEHYSGHRVSR